MKKRLKRIFTRDICFLGIAIAVLILSFYAASQIDFYGESVWISILGLIPIFTALASMMYICFSLPEIKREKDEDKE